ncbi:MAG: MMPL family transporter [Thermoplasmata archaeon]|nr:MMPL family transporter [Thermoplasmata archaeon]
MSSQGRPHGSRGAGIFSALGRWIVRHPWYPIVFWVALLILTLPFLGRLSTVTTNSAGSLPPGSQSALAQAELDRLFPNESAGSSSVILLTGPNITGPVGQGSAIAVATALSHDAQITNFGGVRTLYTSYQSYLQGNAELALRLIGGALAPANGSLTARLNQTAELLWAPPSAFVAEWEALVAAHPNTSAASWNGPAYQATRSALGPSAGPLAVLSAFYGNSSSSGFNRTGGCATVPAAVLGCADQTARATLGPLLPTLVPGAASQPLAQAVLGALAVENYSAPSAQRAVASDILGAQSLLPPSFIDLLWGQFASPGAPPPTPSNPSPSTLANWTSSLVSNGTPSTWPMPMPSTIRSQFVDPTNTGMLVLVSFTEPSGFTDSAGHNPVFLDVLRVNVDVGRVLASTDPGHTLSYWQTGGAALDQDESAIISADLAIVLPLTIVVLILITMLYFRAPLTPMLTFGGLAIALVLGLGGVLLVGTFITKVDPTALTLENTFVLGVGTDYSIFLVARYREELVAGRAPNEAVVESVTWAGQSVATSGATAILATLALAFSGVALLSQWGMVLSLAVLMTVLISLTVVPAILVLLGPRVFWPYTGARFERQTAEARSRIRDERTYFFRAARATQRRPKSVLALILVASIPLLWIALQVPLSFDFYQQLPSGTVATDGLTQLSDHFGAGAAFPLELLVTFGAPLLVGNVTNAQEFSDLGTLTTTLATTAGVASVGSPVGSTGAPLGAWLNYSTIPAAPRLQLTGLLASFVGTDGRTVFLGIVPSSPGLSLPAVHLLGQLESEVGAFASTHPELSGYLFGGGAPTTHDLQQSTALATERMILAVSIGLILVLLAVLRSWIIPLMAVATIGLSIGWAWAITYLVLNVTFGYPLFFYVPTVLFILILGLGIDYNIFLLTRVREERLKGRSAADSAVHAVGRTGGIISAAAVILASAFAILATGDFVLLRAIGFAVATAVILDAVVVRTYLVPAFLHTLGDRVWGGFGGAPGSPATASAEGTAPPPTS